MFTDNQIDQYLKSLSSQRPDISLQYLTAIQSSHVAQYSFNNISVLSGDEILLETDHLFTKIVKENRGGYCFEQNGLFYELLNSLGYSCRFTLARVLNNRPVEPPRTHRVTIVTIDDKQYLVDVGFGPHCPREPLLLNCDTEQDVGLETYRIVQVENEYTLEIIEEGEWFTLYKFDMANYSEADCTVGNYYSYNHPKAVFRNNLVVSLKNEVEIKFIRNNEFHLSRNGERTVTSIASSEMLSEYLKQFSITLDRDTLESIFTNYCVPKGKF